MSAFVVSDKHINTLLSFASRYRHSYQVEKFCFKVTDDLQKMAEILLAENIRSYNYRYNQTNNDNPITFKFENSVSPTQILKACDCYDYQACETNDYYQSKAHKIIQTIRKLAISNLDGYEEAQWEIR